MVGNARSKGRSGVSCLESQGQGTRTRASSSALAVPANRAHAHRHQMGKRRPPRKSTTSAWSAPIAVALAAAAVGIACLYGRSRGAVSEIASNAMKPQQGKARSEVETASNEIKPQRGKATLLHFAAQKGDVNTARTLLQSGNVAIDSMTKLGATALHVAAEQGMLGMVKFLVEAGAAHDMQTDAGLQPLHFAAEQGEEAVARALLEHGATVRAQTNTGHTPLHITSASQKASAVALLEVARTLLEGSGQKAIDARTNLGYTALHLSALMGRRDMAKLLLSSGADADAATEAGHTPLHLAAEKGQLKLIEALVSFGNSALEARTRMGHTPLSVALDEGMDDAASLLLERGADAACNDSRGITPLHIAAGRGASSMVQVLLRASGVRVNAVSSGGLSPLDVAVYGTPTAGGAPIAGGTIAADGSVASDSKIASLLDPTTALEALLDGGASVDASHPWTGQTALHAAAYLGRQSWTDLMLKHGHDSLETNQRGDDYKRHVQRGDGLEQRAQMTGKLAPKSGMRLAQVHDAACAAYEAAIQLAPTSAMAYSRLGTVQARLEDASRAISADGAVGSGSCDGSSNSRACESFKYAWRLKPEGAADANAFAAGRIDLALAGLGIGESGRAPATSVRELSILDVSDTRRALSLWRQQGIVIFPSLLDAGMIRLLQAHAREVLIPDHDETTVDRTANIRAPDRRLLRALSLVKAAQPIQSVASRLAAFLEMALQSDRQLVLELGVMGALPGAAEQGWHRDDGILDSRVASIQVALVDTAAEQGALEVQPGSHTHSEQPVDSAHGVAIAVPAGTVTIYSPNLVHRGRANTHSDERMTAVLTLVGASGLVPNSIPLAVQPGDAGRWWLQGGDWLESS